MNNLRSFEPFISIIHSWKYSKSACYRNQLITFFKCNPMATAQHAKLWITQGINKYFDTLKQEAQPPWTDNSFSTVCSAIKKNIKQNKMQYYTERISWTNNNQIAATNVITNTLINGMNDKEIINILNKISKNIKYDSCLSDINWGDAIQCMNTQKYVIRKLLDNHHYTAAQIQKETLLSSMLVLDKNKQITIK